MKKTLFLTISCVLMSFLTFAQTATTETFETESPGSTSFTDNGVIFNIVSHASTFNIVNFPGTGWNGTANDNRYIDNTSNVGAIGASFSIKTTSNLFKVNRFWVFVANQFTNQNVIGTLTVTGKLSGVTKFSAIKSNNFATGLGTTNGYTLIDMTNLNGQNYSNIVIDELQLTLGGNYYYLGLDAFTWVKDSNIVLGTSDVNAAQKGIAVYPNPTDGPITIKSDTKTIGQIYSQDAKMLKQLSVDKGETNFDLSDLPKGVYVLKTLVHNESIKIIKK